MGQEARYRRKSDRGGDSMSKDSISEEGRGAIGRLVNRARRPLTL
jgi:hypothetical protein